MDKNYASLMSGADVFLMGTRIVRQSWDKWKIGKKLGDQDDLVQQVAEILLSVKAGKIVFDPARKSDTGDTNVSFAGFVMMKARGLGMTNWMLEAPRPRIHLPTPTSKKERANTDTDDDDNDRIAAIRLQTVTPRQCGADEQAHDIDDIEGDDENQADDHEDEARTPAHRLLQVDSSTLAKLLGCTNHTIINMRARQR